MFLNGVQRKDVGLELGKLHFLVCDCDFEKLTHIYFKSGF